MQQIKTLLAKFNLKIAIITTIVLFFLVLFSSASILVLDRELSDQNTSEADSSCNVARIKINGDLVEYKYGGVEEWTDETVGGDIVGTLEKIEKDPNIYASIIEINSPGGSGVAGEEIAGALKRSTKPTIAVIKDQGTSAAYWAATGAQKIFASEFSDIGSIGITQSFVDNAAKNTKDGYTYNQLTSAKYKDMLSGDRPMTQEEKNMVMSDLKEFHKVFVGAIAKNRNLKYEDVAKLADGSSILPPKALETGIIDAIGGTYEAKQSLAEALGLELSDLNVCDY
ncbi:MAG: S49 family peptidase [bacterium]